MAAALAADSSDSLTADLFDCAVCMEDMSDRKPNNLTCGHSFCGRCLENIATENRILCPTCRTETILPEDGVSGLPINLFISKMKENFSAIIIRSSILCGMCLSQDRHTNAAHNCTDCKINMCGPCKDYHLKMGIFNDHKFTLLHSKGNLCSDHRHAIEYVCLECKKGLCVHCTIQSNHQDHTDQIKSLESGIVIAKEEMKDQGRKLSERIKSIQTSCLEVLKSSVIKEEFDLLIDGLIKENDTYQFLQKWQQSQEKCQDINDISMNLAINLDLYMNKMKEPEYMIPAIKVRPVPISTFDEYLGYPGEVAFLEDNSVIYLDTQSNTVARIGVHHGILDNYCLPRKEKVTCLAVQGKHFYLCGNKHVMKKPMLQNSESNQYIKLPDERKTPDQLYVMNDGTFMIKHKQIIRSYHPETKTSKKIEEFDPGTNYSFFTIWKEEQLFLTKRFANEILTTKIVSGHINQYFKQNLDNPMATLVIGNMLLVADHNNCRIVAFDINDKAYLGEVLSREDGIRWPVGLAYKAPYLCITECEGDQNWSKVKFYKWTG